MWHEAIHHEDGLILGADLPHIQRWSLGGVRIGTNQMGVSENSDNSVPLNPMVDDHYPY